MCECNIYDWLSLKSNFMKNALLFFLLLLFTLSWGQIPKKDYFEISFDTLKIDMTKAKEDVLKTIKININVAADSTKNFFLDVVVDKTKTTLIGAEFELFFDKTKLSNSLKSKTAFLKLPKDETWDKERKIFLDLEIFEGDDKLENVNQGTYKTLEITIKPANEKLKGYEYLAYVGTNFDLVEGIKAKDLFFASNIFFPPDKNKKKSIGFYLSLYGNRAFTQIDSTSSRRISESFQPVSDTTYNRIQSTNFLVKKRVTDNIGAYISPLFRIGKYRINKNNNRNLKLYYSPSLEFVYRRTTLSTQDAGITQTDTTLVSGNFSDIDIPQSAPIPNKFSEVYNEYSFNAGIIALFMALENEDISVRVHGSVGYSSNYYREFEADGIDSSTEQRSDIFFSGRAWITESTTGITLQAEVTNSLINPRPFFVATLSKAFKFKEIGRFFQPIVNKSN